MTARNRLYRLFTLAAVLLLSGCIGPASVAPMQQYTLLSAIGTVDPAPARAVNQAPVLRLAEIRAPSWLNSTRMVYRLDYRAQAALAAYSLSEWVVPPPALLAGVLQQVLAEQTRWGAVIGPAVSAQADVTLQITLNGFQQVFTGSRRSAGVVDATATLVDEQVIAQRRFHVASPAPAPNARGGVQALSQASLVLARRIRDWMAIALNAD